MSSSQDVLADLASNDDSTSKRSSGFRSFWKHDKAPVVSPGEATAIDESETSSKKPSDGGRRISWFGKRGKTSNRTQDGESKSTNTDKRRQQVYQAQKRHRNRRAEYIKSLEDEVAELRNLDANVRQEKSTLESQNRIMKEVLASHSIDAQLGSISLAPPSSTSGGDVNMLDYAAVNVRFDPDTFHERTYLDFSGSEEMAYSSDTTSTLGPTIKTPVAGDSWAAVDFILALEWPCRDHMAHPNSFAPGAARTEADPEKYTGHTLTATAAVYDNAIPLATHMHTHVDGTATNHGVTGSAQDQWVLPHSEIEKLVKLSQDLPMDDDQITPAQAYSAIRQSLTSDADLRPILELLKIPLGAIAECRGYGAVLPTEQFWQHVETALTSLTV